MAAFATCQQTILSLFVFHLSWIERNDCFLSHIADLFSVLFLLYFRARLFIDALWPPAGKGLAPWLSCVKSNCEVVTFPLVSWFRCGA